MIWLITGLAGCSTKTVRVVDMTPPKQLAESLPEDQLLDVGISTFIGNIPEDYDDRIAQIISPEIRRAEIRYLPYITKNLIHNPPSHDQVKANCWRNDTAHTQRSS